MEKNLIPTQLKSSIPTNLIEELGKPEQYDHIELDEYEIEEALRVARHAKQIRLNREAYNEKISRPVDWFKPSAEELYQAIAKAITYKGQNFILENEQYEKIIKNMCCYFAGDSRFKGDLGKGLALIGPAGTGKTALMKFFAANQVFSYRVKSVLEITADYKKEGEGAAMQYNANPQGSRNDFGHATFGYCFDDVGMEEVPARHYAESKNVFAEIILMRDLSVPLNSTHITTNIDNADIERLYGSRVYDRMKDMFNIINFGGLESFRGR